MNKKVKIGLLIFVILMISAITLYFATKYKNDLSANGNEVIKSSKESSDKNSKNKCDNKKCEEEKNKGKSKQEIHKKRKDDSAEKKEKESAGAKDSTIYSSSENNVNSYNRETVAENVAADAEENKESAGFDKMEKTANNDSNSSTGEKHEDKKNSGVDAEVQPPVHIVENVTVTISLPDIMCEHCKKTVESVIDKFPEVVYRNVDLASKSATLKVKDKTVVSKIIAAIEETGFRAYEGERSASIPENSFIAKISVPDMMCNNCKKHVENIIDKYDEVIEREVNIETKIATVKVNKKDIIPKIINDLEDSGYPAKQI